MVVTLLKTFRNQLTLFYRSRGYLFSKVQKPIVRKVHNNQVEITYRIFEGRQTAITEIEIISETTEHQKEVLSLLKNQEGRPFNISEVEKDEKRIVNFYLEKGYLGLKSKP